MAHRLVELQTGVQGPDGLLGAADVGVADAVGQTLQHRAGRLLLVTGRLLGSKQRRKLFIPLIAAPWR